VNTDLDRLQALLWRTQAAFGAWSMQATSQQAARQRERLTYELLNTRLLAMLGRRRRRIFERWRVWAVHAELLRVGEERAVIAGQSWRAARVFHNWHEWARCSNVCADLLRFRQHQCLGCWRRAVVAQRELQARVIETCGWRSTRMLQTSIDKLWMFAAHQQRLACIVNQVVHVREWRMLEQCLSGWRLATHAAIEKHETKVVAKAFWRENVGSYRLSIPSKSRLTTDFLLCCSVRAHRNQVLENSVQAWRAEASLLRRYGQALAVAAERMTQRMCKHAFEDWANFIRQDLTRQRWDSTARRALRAWQWHVTLRWEIQAASAELQRRMNRWSVFQAWCTWLRMHDNKCAIQWMLHRSLVLFLSGCLRRWRAIPTVREKILSEGRSTLALHVCFCSSRVASRRCHHLHVWIVSDLTRVLFRHNLCIFVPGTDAQC
jgi:hypothetical protein